MNKDLKSLSGIFEFNFSSIKVKLTKEEFAHLLGYSVKKIPQPIEAVINNVLELIPKYSEPKGGFVILSDKKIIFESDRFNINDTIIQSEKIISRYLQKSDTLAILVATIGSRLENLSKQFMDDGDMLQGYIIDIAASELVENTADLLESELLKITSKKKFGVTNRYSPGYCGWNVNDQHKLFSFLPDNFCGISLTESALMLPVKSISAIIGIGRNAEKEDYQCSLCDTDFCYKRDKKK
ncbi:MAG: hypothetical protein MUO34_12300 [Ignavibacteriaceae bacterium]|nr:hypothetical protein [Ignavibacteriaceae bacterium]